jgi:hypothetical protein
VRALCCAAGQLDKALPLFEQTLAKQKETLGLEHPVTLTSMNNLAGAYQKNGDFAKAELLLRERLTIFQGKDPEYYMTFATQSELGGSLLGQKKYAQAEPLLLAGYKGMKQREAKIPAYAKKVHNRVPRAAGAAVRRLEQAGRGGQMAQGAGGGGKERR